MQLGNWQLKHVVGDTESTYKFHRALRIGPQQTIAIWSSDAEQSNEQLTKLMIIPARTARLRLGLTVRIACVKIDNHANVPFMRYELIQIKSQRFHQNQQPPHTWLYLRPLNVCLPVCLSNDAADEFIGLSKAVHVINVWSRGRSSGTPMSSAARLWPSPRYSYRPVRVWARCTGGSALPVCLDLCLPVNGSFRETWFRLLLSMATTPASLMHAKQLC